MQIISITHALRLRHIDLLREMPIEKGIIYIKLAKSPLAIKGNVKHSANDDEIYHRIESLMKVNSWLLVKSFSNKASFIGNRAVGILFDAKHPFFAHYILPSLGGTKAQVPFWMGASYSSYISSTHLGS